MPDEFTKNTMHGRDIEWTGVRGQATGQMDKQSGRVYERQEGEWKCSAGLSEEGVLEHGELETPDMANPLRGSSLQGSTSELKIDNLEE